ncbi:zinc finger, C2H2 type, partial [Ostertagia ostertagi]
IGLIFQRNGKTCGGIPFSGCKSVWQFATSTEVMPSVRSKCDRGFHSPYELEQHAKRYHPTEKHYSGAPKCPFGCSKRLQRLKSGVTDNVLRLLHVMICHLPDEDAVTWVKNWMKKHESVMETEPVFKFDVQESLNASVESGQCQIMCTFCSSLVEGHKYFAHRRRGSVCYDHNDTMSTKAESSIEKSKERPGRKRRFGMLEPGRIPGSSKIRKNPCTVCKLCSKNIIITEKYSERVSTFLHVLNIHINDQEAQTALVAGYSSTCAEEFPFIDVKASVEGTASTGKPVLQCVICGFKTDTSRRIAMHARHHEDLMRDLGNYPEPCACGEKIRICSEVKESYQRLCHILEKHVADEDRLREAVSSYESDHSPDTMILDRLRSVELTRYKCLTYACSGCDFTSSNSNALIHHSKIHATGSNENSAVKQELPRKTESPNRVHDMQSIIAPIFTLFNSGDHFGAFCEVSP